MLASPRGDLRGAPGAAATDCSCQAEDSDSSQNRFRFFR